MNDKQIVFLYIQVTKNCTSLLDIIFNTRITIFENIYSISWYNLL